MAIAFDATKGATQDTSGGAGPFTFTFSGASSITVGAGLTNSVLLVFLATNGGGDDVSAITWNGTSMFGGLINKNINADSSGFDYIFMLLNPASGNNSIVVTRTTNARVRMCAASYQGVNQSLTVDANSAQTAVGAGSVTATLNTVTNNAWKVVHWYDGNGIPVASTNTTSRSNDGTNSLLGDSGGAITPAGAFDMTATGSVALWTVLEVALAPAGGTAAHLLTLLGVGT